ncbi:MAG: hypothetical protein WCD79_01785 [Chthoniobacteraceae bacterium]
MNPSHYLQSGLFLVRAVVLFLLLLGLWRGLGKTDLSMNTRVATLLCVAVPLIAWFVAMQALAVRGFIQTTPAAAQFGIPIPAVVGVPIAVWLFALMRSGRIPAVIDAVPLSWLVRIQAFRVIGSVFLLQLALHRLPAVFALPAGIGDVLTGLLALRVAQDLDAQKSGTQKAALAWNLFGIADLVVALSIGMLASLHILKPGIPFRLEYPLIMVPAFAVPLALILHALSLWQLRRRRTHAGHRDLESGGIAGLSAYH